MFFLIFCRRVLSCSRNRQVDQLTINHVVDELTVDELTIDELTLDELTWCHVSMAFLVGSRMLNCLSFCSLEYLAVSNVRAGLLTTTKAFCLTIFNVPLASNKRV